MAKPKQRNRPKQKRVKGFLRKIPGRSAKVRVRPHLRKL